MKKSGERNVLGGAKTGRRGGTGAHPRGAAILADRVPAPDYADFVRQRKDDAARELRASRERSLRIAEGIADARVRRAYLRQQAEQERAIDDFWRRFFRRAPKPKDGIARHRRSRSQDGAEMSPHRSGMARRSQGTLPPGAIQLAGYSGPVLDRKGRRGVYLAVSYLGAARTTYGCARRLVRYVTDPSHVEQLDGVDLTGSNVGESRDEMSAAFGLVEDLNRAARANAKIVFHLIVQLPHDVTPAQRAEILGRWCDECFCAHNLPYVRAVHRPDPDGDQRNYHGHVAVSFRPLVRVAPFAWDAGRELKAELDNPQSFRRMRESFARVMTEVAEDAGLKREYTALSYAARGLAIKPTEHLGAHKTRLVRQGEYVAANARNRQKMARNEAMLESGRLKRREITLRKRLARVRAAEARTLDGIHRLQPVAARHAGAVGRPSQATRGRQTRAAVARPAVVPQRSTTPITPPRTPVVVDRATPTTRRSITTPASIDRAGHPPVHTTTAIPNVTRRAALPPLDRPVIDPAAGQSVGRAPASATVAIHAVDRTVHRAASTIPNITHRPVLPPAGHAIVDPSTSNRPKATVMTVATADTHRQTSAVTGQPSGVHDIASVRRQAASITTLDVPTRQTTILPVDTSTSIMDIAVDRTHEPRRPPVLAAPVSRAPSPPPASGIDALLFAAAFGAAAQRRRVRAKAAAPRATLARIASLDWPSPTDAIDAPLDAVAGFDAIAPFDREPAPVPPPAARHRQRVPSSPAASPSTPAPTAAPIPDGFGGLRDTPPPAFVPRETGPRVRAFDRATGRPTRSLLDLLRHCGEQPHSVAFADDGRLTGVGGLPVLIDPLIAMWRHDDAVQALVVETVRASRAAGRAVYPPDHAAAIRALTPARSQPPPGRDVGIGR